MVQHPAQSGNLASIPTKIARQAAEMGWNGYGRWEGGTLRSERHPDPVEAAIRFAIRKIRYSPPKGTVKIVEISTILNLRTNPPNTPTTATTANGSTKTGPTVHRCHQRLLR